MVKLQQILDKFTVSLQCRYIYIMEAHPTDGWHLFDLGDEHCLPTPKTLADRSAAAQKLSKEHNIPLESLYVDRMDNNADLAFAGWPERFYIVENNKIVFKGGKGPDHYHPEDVEDWMNERLKK